MGNTIQNNYLDRLIIDLENKFKNNTIQPQDFYNAINLLNNALYKIQNMLELLKDNNSDMMKIYLNVSNINYSKLVEKLNYIGNKHKENKNNIVDDFNKSGYHIMEQIRAGKRSDAFYSILRIFISNNVNLDKEILTAFEQPDDEMFKVLLLSFLSGIIQNESKEKQKNQ